MLNQAIILCAGAGTRLGDLTKDKPKCLVEVGGKPALDYTLWWMYSSGVRDVRVTVHHHKDVLLNYLWAKNREYSMNGQQHLAMTIAPSVEPELLGTAGGFANAAYRMSDGELLLVYGDVLTNLHIPSMWWDHVSSGADMTMALYNPPNPEECGIVELDGKRMTGIYEKQGRTGLANAGVMIVSSQVTQLIPRGWPATDMCSDILAKYNLNINTHYNPQATVIDMGTPKGLELANKEYYNFL